jgi:hypothetical protein
MSREFAQGAHRSTPRKIKPPDGYIDLAVEKLRKLLQEPLWAERILADEDDELEELAVQAVCLLLRGSDCSP